MGDDDDEVSIRADARPFGGILGYMVFGQFAMSFNYRDKLVVVGGASPPADLLAPTTIPFSLEGGGVGLLPKDLGVLEFPASRIIVPAVIEGTPRTMLLDTGASWVALRTSIFREIVSDGRGQVSDDATLATGRTTTKVTRLRTVSVGGEEVLGAVAAAGDWVDALLLTLSTEVGHPVDGLLGAPYLREFYVTVDYPSHNVALRRYVSEAHLKDDYVRVGFDSRRSPGPLGDHQLCGEPRLQGDRRGSERDEPGDELLAVDGKSVSDADVVSADRLLVGTAGSSLTLQFSKKTVTVQVEDSFALRGPLALSHEDPWRPMRRGATAKTPRVDTKGPSPILGGLAVDPLRSSKGAGRLGLGDSFDFQREGARLSGGKK